jgi:hypothetical protein
MAKKNITVTLYMSELVYDVQNKTYLTGRSRDTGQNFAEVSHMQAGDDEADENQIVRSIGNAFAKLKGKLGEYVAVSSSAGTNEQLSKEKNLVLSLELSGNYNEASTEQLGMALHQYVVNTAIGDWFALTNKADAADYMALAQVNLVDALDAVNRRVRPKRIVQ